MFVAMSVYDLVISLSEPDRNIKAHELFFVIESAVQAMKDHPGDPPPMASVPGDIPVMLPSQECRSDRISRDGVPGPALPVTFVVADPRMTTAPGSASIM
jgi:hypothetical protein